MTEKEAARAEDEVASPNRVAAVSAEPIFKELSVFTIALYQIDCFKKKDVDGGDIDCNESYQWSNPLFFVDFWQRESATAINL